MSINEAIYREREEIARLVEQRGRDIGGAIDPAMTARAIRARDGQPPRDPVRDELAEIAKCFVIGYPNLSSKSEFMWWNDLRARAKATLAKLGKETEYD